MKKLLFVCLILLLIPIVYSSEGRLPLLAVRETESGMEGSSAELILELKEGTGRVFVDTFPLSKVDTQISMRFAKEIACNYIDFECSQYDFIYTIKANSPIIGGPSAGAAATVLTVSVLQEINLFENIAITGTINSGGLIGPVGGIKQKVEAAAKSEVKTVLIPFGENNKINESDNSSLTIKQFGKSLGVKVIEVSELNEALKTFTGIDFYEEEIEIEISSSYSNIMKKLAEELCDRNDELLNSIDISETNEEITNMYEEALNMTTKGTSSFKNNEYYSSASFCFGSNVKLNQVFLEIKDFSSKKYKGLLNQLNEEITSFEKEIDNKKIQTITDLESYMIVKERLLEAKKITNATNESYVYSYAYGNERLRSAYAWSKFFNNQGKTFNLDKKSLERSCMQRLGEAEERLQYAALYIPFSLTTSQKSLDQAYEDMEDEEYALCLFRATKSKSEANIVLNTIGMENDLIPELIDKKLQAARRVILKADQNDMFPVLGYSYFEYATSLKESAPFSALLYAEYALELSSLDMYFQEQKIPKFAFPNIPKSMILVAGIIIGILITMIIIKPSKT